jgi:hypothetical protein
MTPSSSALAFRSIFFRSLRVAVLLEFGFNQFYGPISSTCSGLLRTVYAPVSTVPTAMAFVSFGFCIRRIYSQILVYSSFYCLAPPLEWAGKKAVAIAMLFRFFGLRIAKGTH